MRILFLLLCLIPCVLLAQDGRYSLGARHTALAGASATIGDEWAIFNNPAGLANLEATSAIVTFRNRYAIQGFHIQGGGAVYHHRLFNVGVKYFKFGDDLFNQQVVGLVLANRIQMVSLGAGINVIQTHVEGFTDQRIVALELGGTAELTEKIVLGAHIFNFKHGQQYPTTMKAGLSFRPIDLISLNVELEKQLESRERFKTGLEYEVVGGVLLRTGVRLQGNEFRQANINGTYGLGLKFYGFLFDYAFTNETLGAIHEISLAYRLTKKQ